MAIAPYQLWIDLAPIASAIRTSGSIITVTTQSAHGLTTGAYVQMSGATGTSGTSINGVFQITATSGSAFTYAAAGTDGTATTTAAAISNDLMNPPINFSSGANRNGAMVADISSLTMSSNGDGSGSTMSFSVLQDVTPATGPWFNLIPDNTRVRLCDTDTGSVPASGETIFLGLLMGVDASLNGSGQGTETGVTLGEVNVLLDRLGVFGQNTATRTLKATSATRASNITTLTFPSNHGFAAGQQIKVSGFSGGGSKSFNGIFTIATTPTSNTLTYSNTGTSCTSGGDTGGGPLTFTVTRKGRSNDTLVLKATGSPSLVTNNFNISSGDTIWVKGILGIAGSGWSVGNVQLLRERANGTFSGSQVNVLNAYTIELRMSAPITGSWGTFYTGALLNGSAPQAGPPIVNGQMIVKIAAGVTETAAVNQFLSLVNAYKSSDYALQRLINTGSTANISGGTVFSNNQEVQFGATTFRSALDTIIETYSGNDIKERRTFIDVDGSLNYLLVDPTAQPTYPTAPYSIVTDGAGTPNSTTKSSVSPFSLSVNWDHDTTKAAMFTIPASSGQSLTQVWAYTDLLTDSGTASPVYSERVGAPTMDGVVEFPTAVINPGAQIQRAAAAYFIERHKPMLSGSFELRGGGTAAWNMLGFGSGYAPTGTASGTLVKSWKAGQWVEISCPSLALSGLYRVEQVDWSLEPGSYLQRIAITFNRRNPNDLAALVAAAKS